MRNVVPEMIPSLGTWHAQSNVTLSGVSTDMSTGVLVGIRHICYIGAVNTLYPSCFIYPFFGWLDPLWCLLQA